MLAIWPNHSLLTVEGVGTCQTCLKHAPVLSVFLVAVMWENYRPLSILWFSGHTRMFGRAHVSDMLWDMYHGTGPAAAWQVMPSSFTIFILEGSF